MSKRYTITAALPYANGALHLGHLAGAYLPADLYARFLRLKGNEVAFVCGSDEHGAAITMRAKKEGRSPQDIIDTYHELNKSSFEQLGISFDIYHRTSEALHHKTAQSFFTDLLEKGDQFEVRETEQYYDEAFDQFLADRYITGTCPVCGYEDADGDQCENCGSALSPTELVNPKSALSDKTPVLRKTQHWYFRLDAHADWLKTWLNTGTVDGKQVHAPKNWKNHVIAQCNSWLDTQTDAATGEQTGGLQPRAITRDLDWGIPVPLEAAKGKVLYVWFDAPIGYISATKQWAADHGKDWETYWKDEDTELVHFIGKDNIVFHCIVFPAMLKAHGGYNLPKNVPANQFLNLEGRKFSKSKGWVIEQHQYLEDFKDFPNKEDALRYALIRTLPENKDGDFKWEEFVALHDNELVANLGNLVNRVITLTHKYYEGKVPALSVEQLVKGIEEGSEVTVTQIYQDLLAKIDQLEELMQHYEFRQSIQVVMEVSAYANTLLQRNEPWKIWKTDPDSTLVQTVMHLSLQLVTTLSVLVQPFLPFTAAKLRRILQLPSLQGGDWTTLTQQLGNQQAALPTGHTIAAPELLFAKINDRKDKSRLALIEHQQAHITQLREQLKAQTTTVNKQPPVFKETCTFEDFMKIDLRVGTIQAAESIKKTKKLLKLSIDLGLETRTVVSGIAMHYTPEKVIGQRVVVVANLAPRKMMGIESQGMVLMTENAAGKLLFVEPQATAENGAPVV